MSLRADQYVREQSTTEWLVGYNGANPERNEPEIREPRSQCQEPLPSSEGAVLEHDWVPEGQYWIRYLEHELIKDFHGYGNKLVIHFMIQEGPFTECEIRAFYNVIIIGETFIAKGGSRWVKEMRRLFPEIRKEAMDPWKRPRPLPVSLIKNMTILAEVEDSGKGRKKKKKDEEIRPYSVVRELLKPAGPAHGN